MTNKKDSCYSLDLSFDWQDPSDQVFLSSEIFLNAERVDIWRADLNPTTIPMSHFFSLLSTDEQERAQRFHFERDRRRYTVGRGILRILLGRYLNQDPGCLTFHYSAHGKPILASASLQFNVSHAQELAVYAITAQAQIGIDLEYVRSDVDAEGIAKRFFRASEYQLLCQLPPDQQRQAFYRYWTAKEACLKAVGTGIAHLSHLELALGHNTIGILTWATENPKDWIVQQGIPAPKYMATLAVKGSRLTSCFWRFLGISDLTP
jgi:4'-phosphopantetheinyl transferase